MKKILVFFFVLSVFVFSGDIKFSILLINGKHRKVVREIVQDFEQKNPSIKVQIKELDNNNYHKFMEKEEFLNQDVVWWFAGYQLKEFAAKGIAYPLNKLWNDENLFDKFKSSVKSVSYNDQVYAIPLNYYQWGMYYNEEVLKENNLDVPTNWEEFENVCGVLKSKGITPLAIGVKNNWTAAAWFSYMNLRINGLQFHLNLLNGKESYKDERVKNVFIKWKELLDKGYFNDDMNKHDWKGILAYIYRKRYGMTLIGNFVVNEFKPAVKGKMKFFRFPMIDSSMPYYEEAPTDILFLNNSSKNKEDSMKFLAYWSKTVALDKYNDTLGYLSPHKDSKVGSDYFTKVGAEVLGSAEGVSQFFDRDTSKSMAGSGFKALGDFMRDPDIEIVINELENLRKENWK